MLLLTGGGRVVCRLSLVYAAVCLSHLCRLVNQQQSPSVTVPAKELHRPAVHALRCQAPERSGGAGGGTYTRQK